MIPDGRVKYKKNFSRRWQGGILCAKLVVKFNVSLVFNWVLFKPSSLMWHKKSEI